RDFIIDTAEKENIPFQYEVIPGGGTDAGRFHIHGNGVPSIFIGAPSRYIHSAASIIHQDDIDNAVNLLTAVIKRLDRTTVNTLTTY
ncbi:MAG: peptidase M28, partial [Bacilli bacterium]